MSEVDIGTLVARLSEHPELVEAIRALADGGEAPVETAVAPPPPKEFPVSDEARRRRRLIEAAKPYLSERRAKAADALLLIAEILDRLSDGTENETR